VTDESSEEPLLIKGFFVSIGGPARRISSPPDFLAAPDHRA
jgi:hypothetical protein